jgi:hypothetical protein
LRFWDQQYALGDSGPKTPAGSFSIVMNSTTATRFGTSFIVSFAPSVAAGPVNLKTINGKANANVKTKNGKPIAQIKSINGLE